MNRPLSILAICAGGIAVACITSISADAQGPTPVPSVWLQATSTGPTQTGHINIGSAGPTIVSQTSSNATSAAAILGTATHASGIVTGVHGKSNSTLGTGVVGEGGIRGLYGVVNSSNGTAVEGFAFSSTGNTYGGFFGNYSPAGFAGFFTNPTLGSSYEVELAGPNGAINTAGFVYREYTASTRSAAIPIAYGTVSQAPFSILSGSGNFTLSVGGSFPNFYPVIDVAGEAISLTTCSVVVNVIETSTPRIATWAVSPSNGIEVRVWTLAGNLTASSFSFVVYKGAPTSDDGGDGDSFGIRTGGRG